MSCLGALGLSEGYEWHAATIAATITAANTTTNASIITAAVVSHAASTATAAITSLPGEGIHYFATLSTTEWCVPNSTIGCSTRGAR